MAYTEIDRENKKIKFYFPTNKPAKRIKEWQEELKGYDRDNTAEYYNR